MTLFGDPLFDDLVFYELCFPGAVTGSTEVECPHCNELLTVPVNDPMGEESYQCRQCSGVFEVDWVEGQVRYDAPGSLVTSVFSSRQRRRVAGRFPVW
jgi:DNA-directed RNA polymerase subunit RPC12/RpoP